MAHPASPSGKLQLHVAVVGAPGVGKTTIVRSWLGLGHTDPPGPEKPSQTYTLHREFMGNKVFVVHDLRGDVTALEAARCLDLAHAVVLVYDCQRMEETLHSLEQVWLPRIRHSVTQTAAFLFFGNKKFVRATHNSHVLGRQEKKVYDLLTSPYSLYMQFGTKQTIDFWAEHTVNLMLCLTVRSRTTSKTPSCSCVRCLIL